MITVFLFLERHRTTCASRRTLALLQLHTLPQQLPGQVLRAVRIFSLQDACTTCSSCSPLCIALEIIRNCNSKEILWERIFCTFLHVARVTAAMATKFGSKSASKLPNSTATILTARSIAMCTIFFNFLVYEHRCVQNFQIFSNFKRSYDCNGWSESLQIWNTDTSGHML